jgi:hypothetical protein
MNKVCPSCGSSGADYYDCETCRGEPNTTDKSRELFNALKREGECFHRFFTASDRRHPFSKFMWCVCRCGKQFEGDWNGAEMIDFFSPPSEEQAAINFFWLWNRAIDTDWWGNFIAWTYGREWNLDYEDLSNYLIWLVKVDIFADALHSYLSQKGQVVDVQA